MTLGDLRRLAVARSLFAPGTLENAIERFGFVQADPIRAPARAQDLVLRHRVADYHAGDLERDYVQLGIEEDFFIVYGFITRKLRDLMHPRPNVRVAADGPARWSTREIRRAREVLAFIRERGEVHPREVSEHFEHGVVRNWWGGSSSATTHLLSGMHYRGMVRIARRENGIRIYAERVSDEVRIDVREKNVRLDALVDAAVAIYAPLPAPCLTDLVRRIRFAVPQWDRDLKDALLRAKQRLATVRVDGVNWYWPLEDMPDRLEAPDAVRLLAPFDPIVWDRNRFELLWGWMYRFEAYTPAAKRKLGYYALPLLWRDRVIGWGNLSVAAGALKADFGYVAGHPPRDRAFRRELEAEIDRIRRFLRL